MGKWAVRSDDEWRWRVTNEAKQLALQASRGALDGPELVDAIVALVVRASERRPQQVTS